ncbi:MAG: RNA ligase RtcB family protein [Alteromonadaceae bacterium]|nr:MAG: RNA ligase RtcB family protein [Alteromonadaceae bacterium]
MGSIIKTLEGDAQAQMRLIISDKNWLESSAIEQLKKTAELPCMCCAVGMPDLHPGKGQPIGAAFISRGHIYPHLVGSDIGCGMGVWKLNVAARGVKLDRWEKKLVGLDDPWDGDRKSWLQYYIPPGLADSLLYKVAARSLGTIGGGNHFAEFQKIETIFDEDELSKISLDKNSVVLLAHSGSRGLGQWILREHVEKFGEKGLSESDVDTHIRYMRQHDFAAHWARANRALIAKRFSDCLGLQAEPLLDVSHNTVMPLPAEMVEPLGLIAGVESRYWIHRKGASPTDQGLVMIPGSRGSLSYLVKPCVEDASALAQGAYSLAHGAGRKWNRSDARGRLEMRFKAKDLHTTAIGSRVICAQRDLLYEEAPQAYKNIDLVVDDLVQAGMVRLVAAFKPLISYKTRKK